MKNLQDYLNESLIINEANNWKRLNSLMNDGELDTAIEEFDFKGLAKDLSKLTFAYSNQYNDKVKKIKMKSADDQWWEAEENWDDESSIGIVAYDFNDGDSSWECVDDDSLDKVEKIVDKWAKEVKLAPEVKLENYDGYVFVKLIF